MPPEVRRTANTLFAEPYPRDAFITNVADFAEATAEKSKIHFYEDIVDLAANAGHEYEVMSFAVREELAWNVDRYPGTNVRMDGRSYDEAVFGYDRSAPGSDTGKLTARVVPNPGRPFDLDRLLDDFFTDLR